MKTLDRIFSDQFVNRAAVSNNRLLLLMYRFAYPFARLLNKLNVSPDVITSLSLASAIFAFGSLVENAGSAWFCTFWGLTVLLDFCDGTVARMSNRIATRAFRYDHMSDIFKIFLVVLGAAIHFDERVIWVMSATFVFAYLYSEVLSHDLKHAVERKPVAVEVPVADNSARTREVRLRERFPLLGFVVTKMPVVYGLIQLVYVAVTTFNGHTLLVFLALPFGGWITLIALAYLNILALHSCVAGIKSLWRMQR
jgi:phosphatidylglycerophosphate synthase